MRRGGGRWWDRQYRVWTTRCVASWMLLLHMQEIVPVDFRRGLLSSRGGGADILAPGLQCIAETAHVREVKVILMLVLGQHECDRGKFYINIIKLVFSKLVSQGWSCRSRLAISSLDPPLINASTDYDYNERVFVFYMFNSLSNLKLSVDIFIMYKLIKGAMISSRLPLVVSYLKKQKLTFNV